LITQVIREETLDSPRAFLDRLSPRGPLWNDQPQAWAYRGHADASWSLIPSALRQTQTLVTEDEKQTGVSIAWESSWVSELMTLVEFLDISDSVALALPDHTFARSALNYLRSRITVPPDLDSTQTKKFVAEFGDWPPSEVLGVLALAQHYGVQTRLLDWSRRASVAAYFAAAAAVRTGIGTGFLAVWAMRLEMAGRAFPPQAPNRLPRIEIVSPALSSNANMAAQGGFFTVDRSKSAPQGLEVTVANSVKQLKPEYQNLAQPAFWKFLLPREQAPQLLKFLAMEDVHAATLFPGFAGVASHLNERRLLWRR
jgi:hypothetical protein